MHTCLANLVIHIETTANLLSCKTNKQNFFFKTVTSEYLLGFRFMNTKSIVANVQLKTVTLKIVSLLGGKTQRRR